MISSSSQRGFGLIEALVASAIIALVASGVVALNVSVVRNTSLLADRLVAFEWAQEGIEVIRQIRDSNLIDHRPETDWKCFNPGVSPPPAAANNFECGFNNESVTAAKVFRLALSGNEQRWILAEGTQVNQFPTRTAYTRTIKVLPAGPRDPERRLIRVTVSFKFGSRDEQVTLSTIVSNWRRET